MKVKQPYLIVMLRRSENEKTPLTVFPHEIDVLKALHGEDSIIETDDNPPVKSSEFDTEEEYSRLQGMYIGNDKVPNPVRDALGDVDDFEKSFEESGDNEEQLVLLEEAKSLGIKATKNWGIQKLTDAIAEAKGKE